LKKLGVNVDETIDMMHIATCVYESAKNCSSIRFVNYRRFTDQNTLILVLIKTFKGSDPFKMFCLSVNIPGADKP